ncbi:MAG: hypothetical protein KF698_02175 [Anaerolineales bacterium]|nr:hypothetical protein [Anaerolineales bacterium]
METILISIITSLLTTMLAIVFYTQRKADEKRQELLELKIEHLRELLASVLPFALQGLASDWQEVSDVEKDQAGQLRYKYKGVVKKTQDLFEYKSDEDVCISLEILYGFLDSSGMMEFSSVKSWEKQGRPLVTDPTLSAIYFLGYQTTKTFVPRAEEILRQKLKVLEIQAGYKGKE